MLAGPLGGVLPTGFALGGSEGDACPGCCRHLHEHLTVACRLCPKSDVHTTGIERP